MRYHTITATVLVLASVSLYAADPCKDSLEDCYYDEASGKMVTFNPNTNKIKIYDSPEDKRPLEKDGDARVFKDEALVLKMATSVDAQYRKADGEWREMLKQMRAGKGSVHDDAYMKVRERMDQLADLREKLRATDSDNPTKRIDALKEAAKTNKDLAGIERSVRPPETKQERETLRQKGALVVGYLSGKEQEGQRRAILEEAERDRQNKAREALTQKHKEELRDKDKKLDDLEKSLKKAGVLEGAETLDNLNGKAEKLKEEKEHFVAIKENLKSLGLSGGNPVDQVKELTNNHHFLEQLYTEFPDLANAKTLAEFKQKFNEQIGTAKDYTRASGSPSLSARAKKLEELGSFLATGDSSLNGQDPVAMVAYIRENVPKWRKAEENYGSLQTALKEHVDGVSLTEDEKRDLDEDAQILKKLTKIQEDAKKYDALQGKLAKFFPGVKPEKGKEFEAYRDELAKEIRARDERKKLAKDLRDKKAGKSAPKLLSDKDKAITNCHWTDADGVTSANKPDEYQSQVLSECGNKMMCLGYVTCTLELGSETDVEDPNSSTVTSSTIKTKRIQYTTQAACVVKGERCPTSGDGATQCARDEGVFKAGEALSVQAKQSGKIRAAPAATGLSATKGEGPETSDRAEVKK